MGIAMNSDYKENDYLWIRELLDYPMTLEKRLGEFSDTSQIQLPEDPIDCVIFQDRAKWAIRKIAQNKGHILMVGRPGTGKSMLAKMFKEVLSKSIGDYLRPKEVIVAYPGKDITISGSPMKSLLRWIKYFSIAIQPSKSPEAAWTNSVFTIRSNRPEILKSV